MATEPQFLALTKALAGDVEVVREACASAIGQIGSSNKSLAVLARSSLDALEDGSAFVREAAQQALQSIPELEMEDFDVPQSVH